MKTNIKVENAFRKLEEKLIAYPTHHDMITIKRVMQEMYDLGFADGYASFLVGDELDVTNINMED